MRDNFFGAAGWDNLSFEEWENRWIAFKEAVRVLKKVVLCLYSCQL